MKRNIELKARLDDPAGAETACGKLGARAEGELSQVDTYFHVKDGRLKLRDFEDGCAELIAYRRPDAATARASDYAVESVGPGVGRLLGMALGVRVVVRKKRRLYLWKNVRIHLDQVEQLGNFIEFEAVLDDQYDDTDGQAKISHLRDLFAIEENDILSCSYAEMMLEAQDTSGLEQEVRW